MLSVNWQAACCPIGSDRCCFPEPLLEIESLMGIPENKGERCASPLYGQPSAC
jgi:hypothetical protein